jgi:hypothetical protein
MSGRLLGERMAGVGRVRSQLRGREQRPLSHDLDRCEWWRSRVPLARRSTAVLFGRVPRRMHDGLMGSMELVLAYMRDGSSTADSSRERSHLGRRHGMSCHDRRSGMRGACLPHRLRRDSVGCMGDMHFVLPVGLRSALALRKRGGVQRRSGVPTTFRQRSLLRDRVHGLQHDGVEQLE